jgi:hypothetical protein
MKEAPEELKERVRRGEVSIARASRACWPLTLGFE